MRELSADVGCMWMVNIMSMGVEVMTLTILSSIMPGVLRNKSVDA